MRKRIKLSCIASSENYQLTKKIHEEYIRREHENNLSYLSNLPSSPIFFVKCFGKLIQITEQEKERLDESLYITM